tara:strand:+ start:46 stop:408 length:363 start_codon:yes stop_codon:yes gene_type:complete
MKTWILLLALLSPAIARANTVTPQFTTGSMQSTTTTSQTITEEIVHDVLGAEVTTYSGTNITVGGTGGIGADTATYTPVTGENSWDFSITTREAGTIETITIDRTIETDSTTNSYSIFSQ